MAFRALTGSAGSPPRMRGKAVPVAAVAVAAGITPACAGKRQGANSGPSCPQDHPRVCGEKNFLLLMTSRRSGSPPHVRGKAANRDPQRPQHGITPAYAGKRRCWAGCKLLVWDHPRVCGEKVPRLLALHSPLGSPPRMRGKDALPRPLPQKQGITPACAGKSSIQHLTASLGEFEVQKGHPVPHLRQRLQVWPDHARHLRHGLILHASRSAGQGRRLCPGPCPDTAGSGTPRGSSPAKRPHTSPPAATPGGCRAWQSGATAPVSR